MLEALKSAWRQKPAAVALEAVGIIVTIIAMIYLIPLL